MSMCDDRRKNTKLTQWMDHKDALGFSEKHSNKSVRGRSIWEKKFSNSKKKEEKDVESKPLVVRDTRKFGPLQ